MFPSLLISKKVFQNHIPGLNISTGNQQLRQKFKFCLMKTASQRIQLSGMKLKKNLQVTDVLKFKRIWFGQAFLALVFLFMNILLDSLFMRFFIFKIVKFVRVKRFYTSTLVFFALLETAFPLKTFCHYIALITQRVCYYIALKSYKRK